MHDQPVLSPLNGAGSVPGSRRRGWGWLWPAIALLAVVVLCSGIVLVLALASRRESSYRAVIQRSGWGPGGNGQFSVEFELSRRDGKPFSEWPVFQAFDARTDRPLPLVPPPVVGSPIPQRNIRTAESYLAIEHIDPWRKRVTYVATLAQPVVGPLYARLKVREARPPEWWRRLLPPDLSAEPPWFDVVDGTFTLPPMPAPAQAPTSKP